MSHNEKTGHVEWLRECAGDLEADGNFDDADRMRSIADAIESRERLINSPELENFLRGVHVEAVHQVERWGVADDRAKRPADWFWLVGYLAGKALHAAIAGDFDKARHHCISTAAALYNWHCAIRGIDVRMAPGRSDVAEIVERSFPGEAA